MKRVPLGRCASASVRYIPGDVYETYLSGGGAVKLARVTKQEDGAYRVEQRGVYAYADEALVLRDGRKLIRRGAEVFPEKQE